VAQEPIDSLTAATQAKIAQGTGETDTIKREIERTRVEMSETLGEIQERLRPEHLMQQAREGVKDAAADKAKSIMNSAGEGAATMAYHARGAGESLVSYVQAHPIRVALALGAVTWWMLRSRERSDVDWYGTADTSWEEEDAISFGRPSLRSRVGEYASSARETVGEYASTARETVGEYASSARETVGEYASSARETAGAAAESARERARNASLAARRAASTATSSVDDWVQENPLAVGAIALAVGAAIAMSVPATEIENRTMGEARDRAWERATKAATEIKENVTRKVETVAENFVQENVLNTLTGTPTEPMGRA
jgi:ElaB/YqjD/DUF883 family membrane-anchored ribosome-binding protein